MNNSHYTLPNITDDMKRNLKKLKNIRIGIRRVKLYNFTLLSPDNQCLVGATFQRSVSDLNVSVDLKEMSKTTVTLSLLGASTNMKILRASLRRLSA